METTPVTNPNSLLIASIREVAAEIGLSVKGGTEQVPCKDEYMSVSDGSFEYDFRVDYRGRGVYFTDELTTRCEPKHLKARFRAGLRALHAKQVQFDAERRERDDVDTFCKALRGAAPGEYALSFASRDAAGNYLFRFSFLKPNAVIRGALDLRTRGLQHAIDTVRSLLAVQ